MASVERSVLVPAPAAEVWARVVSADGINHELRPWLTMRMPRSARASTIEDVPLEQVLGRAWLLLFGVLPIDYDRLMLVARDHGRSFHEQSTMLSMRRWEHRRTLTSVDDHTTRITDELVLEPRLGLLTPVLVRVVRALFGHRHRRLQRYFGPVVGR